VEHVNLLASHELVSTTIISAIFLSHELDWWSHNKTKIQLIKQIDTTSGKGIEEIKQQMSKAVENVIHEQI